MHKFSYEPSPEFAARILKEKQLKAAAGPYCITCNQNHRGKRCDTRPIQRDWSLKRG